MSMINTITNREHLHPEEIADTMYYFLKNNDIEIGNSWGELEDALYWIKATAENPFNAEYFRVFLDVLSTVSEIMKEKDII